jgi:hypothetical protein
VRRHAVRATDVGVRCFLVQSRTKFFQLRNSQLRNQLRERRRKQEEDEDAGTEGREEGGGGGMSCRLSACLNESPARKRPKMTEISCFF